MSTLITLLQGHLAFGDRPLLDGAQLTVNAGERLGLIGRNGTGKSTLLRVIAGLTSLDEGELQRREGLQVGFVDQEPVLPAAASLRTSLLERAGGTLGLLPDDRERWRWEARLTEFLHRFGLQGDEDPGAASGGQRKRAALALALALQPELLILDEPTNHLDIQGIERLEELLLKVPSSIVVTHDRAFLDRMTTRIIELDRGVLRSYPGSFSAYEERKAEELAAEDTARRRFDKLWQQEEVWIRKGVEARRTRNEGRVRRLEQLRRERAARHERLGALKLSLDTGERSGELVAELTDVTVRFGESPLIEGLSMRLMRGDRIGLIGPNGAGKSTLIRVILGELAPMGGSVRRGTQLNVAYFDQLRAQLDLEAPLAHAISPGSDWIQIGTERQHVISYLGDFLFPPERAKSPVKMLSGGERNRLLLARLFARPANLLVLDEPTNDLDIESLELLEEKLQGYTGTLLLVSHDRRFLDNVVTQTLVAEGNGIWREHAGGYSDWLQYAQASALTPAPADRMPSPRTDRTPRARLSYKEQRELAALPDEIEALEREQREITERMSTPGYHAQGAEQIRTDTRRLKEIEELLLAKLARWEQLEAQVS
jgi:ATP-binding cassette subfamily F protein uup